MSERTRFLGLWGGRLGRTAGRLAVVGGIGVALWGGGQVVDSVFINTPDYNDTPSHSTTDPMYLEAVRHDADQLGAGLNNLVTGTTVALAGFALDTMLYRRPEDEITENLPVEQGGLVDQTGAVDEI